MSTSGTQRITRIPVHQFLSDFLRKTFSLPSLLGSLLVAGSFLALLGGLITVTSDPASVSRFWLLGDTWWQLAIGRQILATHSWPRVDMYSFTMLGKPWIAYEWLGEVLIAAAWKIGGLQGLMGILTTMAGVITVLLFYYCYIRTRNATGAFLACAALLPLASLSFALRPQLFGYAFLVVTLIILEKFRQGKHKALWALPVVFLAWVNTHGTFILGFLILGIYWASGLWEFRRRGIYSTRWTSKQRKQLELVSLFCLIASILTPYGTRLAVYPFEMLLFQPVILKVVTEWQPFHLITSSGAIFIGALVIFFIGLVCSKINCRLQDFALLVLATVETLLHARFILLFVPAFIPILAQVFARWLPKRDGHSDRRLANAVLMACVAIALVRLFPSKSLLQEKVRLTAPVDAARFISSHPNLGRMFTYYDWGSYLMFDLGRQHKVFMDGRLDLYVTGQVFQDYLTVYWTLPGMWAVLNRYKIHSCLVPPRSPLATRLTASLQWKEVYHDSTSAIFVKKKSAEATPERVSDASSLDIEVHVEPAAETTNGIAATALRSET